MQMWIRRPCHASATDSLPQPALNAPLAEAHCSALSIVELLLSRLDEQEHVGLVAQDVQAVIPEAVTENSKGYLLVDNDPIIWSMLNAIKEQQALIQKQQAEIDRLTRQVKTIQATLKASGRSSSEVRTVKVEGTTVHQ